MRLLLPLLFLSSAAANSVQCLTEGTLLTETNYTFRKNVGEVRCPDVFYEDEHGGGAHSLCRLLEFMMPDEVYCSLPPPPPPSKKRPPRRERRTVVEGAEEPMTPPPPPPAWTCTRLDRGWGNLFMQCYMSEEERCNTPISGACHVVFDPQSTVVTVATVVLLLVAGALGGTCLLFFSHATHCFHLMESNGKLSRMERGLEVLPGAGTVRYKRPEFVR
jgi:hypothetical protein